MTFQEFIDAAIFQSGLQNVDAQAEALVPTVFQNVATAYANDPERRNLLRRTHTLTLTNGVADLPAEALSAGKAGATISHATDTSVAQNAAMVSYWNDFVAPRSGLLLQIPQWFIDDDDGLLNQFYYLEADEEYDPASGYTGSLVIRIASVPEIPATAGATLNAPSEVISDLINALALELRNQATKAAA